MSHVMSCLSIIHIDGIRDTHT